jgi:hypothetical protein
LRCKCNSSLDESFFLGLEVGHLRRFVSHELEASIEELVNHVGSDCELLEHASNEANSWVVLFEVKAVLELQVKVVLNHSNDTGEEGVVLAVADVAVVDGDVSGVDVEVWDREVEHEVVHCSIQSHLEEVLEFSSECGAVGGVGSVHVHLEDNGVLWACNDSRV